MDEPRPCSSVLSIYGAPMMARGLTNKDISSILKISIDTVKSHLRHVFAKMDVETRGGGIRGYPPRPRHKLTVIRAGRHPRPIPPSSVESSRRA